VGKSRIRTAEDPKAIPATTETRLTTSVLSLELFHKYTIVSDKHKIFCKKILTQKKKFSKEFLKSL